jgi:hypothetical protein
LAKKLALFSKANATINFLQKLAVAWAKTRNIFAKFFGKYIFKITTSVPGYHYEQYLANPKAQTLLNITSLPYAHIIARCCKLQQCIHTMLQVTTGFWGRFFTQSSDPELSKPDLCWLVQLLKRIFNPTKTS